LEHEDIVVVVELELGVSRVRKIVEERTGKLRQLGAKLEVEVRSEIGIRAIELVVQTTVDLQPIEGRLSALELPSRSLRALERQPRRVGVSLSRCRRDISGAGARAGAVSTARQSVTNSDSENGIIRVRSRSEARRSRNAPNDSVTRRR